MLCRQDRCDGMIGVYAMLMLSRMFLLQVLDSLLRYCAGDNVLSSIPRVRALRWFDLPPCLLLEWRTQSRSTAPIAWKYQLWNHLQLRPVRLLRRVGSNLRSHLLVQVPVIRRLSTRLPPLARFRLQQVQMFPRRRLLRKGAGPISFEQ